MLIVNEQLGGASPWDHWGLLTRQGRMCGAALAQCCHFRCSQTVLLLQLFKRVKYFAYVRQSLEVGSSGLKTTESCCPDPSSGREASRASAKGMGTFELCFLFNWDLFLRMV